MERFAEALAVFHTAEWEKAAKAFEVVLKDFPAMAPAGSTSRAASCI